MNPSTALGLVVVDELIRLGVRHVVVCPGSRSAPLAYAVLRADRAGLLRLHVRVDERSAAFLALGLAKASRIPAAVVTTSGTAVANLHPAVLEADAAGVPLILVTADRPPELRGTRANQTTDQAGFFGSAVRWQHDLGVPDGRAGEAATWRTATDRAYASAVGSITSRSEGSGPVHLNVPLREPLVPDLRCAYRPAQADPPDRPVSPPRTGWTGLPADLAGRPNGRPWTQVVAGPPASSSPDGPGIPDAPRTLVLLGDLPDPRHYRLVLRLARAREWPVLAEPFGERPESAGPGGPGPLPHATLMAAGPTLREDLTPQRILVVGRLTLSRAVAALLRQPGVAVDLVATQPTWPDPGHVVQRVYPWSALVTCALAVERTDPDVEDAAASADGWVAAWQQAGERVHRAVAPVVERSWPSGPAVAQALLAALPAGATLFVGSSAAVRDVDLVRHRDRAVVLASRGLAGIDGSLATAVGLALADPASPCYALVGDLTFLHDLNGLLIGPLEVRPDLTIVVVNDDGGGIFTTLEYGEPERAADFERIFTTPTGAVLARLCQAHRVDHRHAETAAELVEAVGRPPRGLRVIEVRLDQTDRRRLQEQLACTAEAAVRGRRADR